MFLIVNIGVEGTSGGGVGGGERPSARKTHERETTNALAVIHLFVLDR